MLHFLLPSEAYAKDLGKIGTIYPIAENDLMVLIQQRFADMEKNGGIAKLQNEFQNSIRKEMDRPQPVGGLSPTLTPHSFLFDPTVSVPHDIRDSNNNMLAAKGTPVNALDSSNNFTPLIFYNADSQDQSAWALKNDKALKGNDMLILVGGSVFDQTIAIGKSVYFDQGGMLTTRFGITHVPAIVTQKGNRLLMKEELPE